MWSLNYDGVDYGFDRVSVTSVEIEGRSYRVDDTPNPRSDGVGFGQDFADPGDVKLRLLVTFQNVRNVTLQRQMLKDAAHGFLKAWDAATLRAMPGAVGELLIPEIGMIEGRPRRAQWDWSTFGLGYLIGSATFIPHHSGVYVLGAGGVATRSVAVDLVPPLARTGWVFPLVFPVQNLDPVVRATWFEVGGDTETACVVEIKGPLQAGASVEIAEGWSIVTKRALAYDETAVADARPGRRVLTVNGNPTNFLAPSSSRLSELFLSPGSHQVSFRGISPEGTAKARVMWRDMKVGS